MLRNLLSASFEFRYLWIFLNKPIYLWWWVISSAKIRGWYHFISYREIDFSIFRAKWLGKISKIFNFIFPRVTSYLNWEFLFIEILYHLYHFWKFHFWIPWWYDDSNLPFPIHFWCLPPNCYARLLITVKVWTRKLLENW